MQIAKQLCNAMSYLHIQGIIHGNFASLNVLAVKLQTKYQSLSDATGISQWKVKVSDFAMSRYTDEKRNILNKSSQMMDGNLLNCVDMWPNWASPEVLRGEQPTEASDVYSFGLIVYEMLTGEVPNESRSLAQLTGAVGHFEDSLRAPQNCDIVLKQIVNNCLIPDASRRPSFTDIIKIIEDEERPVKHPSKQAFIGNLKDFLS